MKLLRLITFASVVLISLRVSAIDDRYYELADSADHAIGSRQWAEAEKYILEALRLEPAAPGNVMLMSNLGIVQMHRDEPEKAIATLTDALAIAPRSLVILNNRARVYAASGCDREAMRDYCKMIEIDSLSTDALFGRGMLALVDRDMRTAEADFERLETLAPDSRDTHIAMATLQTLRGQYEEAEMHYTALIESEPCDEYYLGRAVCRIKTGKYTEAGEDLSEGIRLNPDNADLYAQQSMLCRLTYRTTEAGLYMRRARQLGYDD